MSDLVGTVWEWCGDELDDTVRESMGEVHLLRILKGGSALEHPDKCGIQATRRMRGDVRRPDRGFRVCLGPPSPEMEDVLTWRARMVDARRGGTA